MIINLMIGFRQILKDDSHCEHKVLVSFGSGGNLPVNNLQAAFQIKIN